MQLKDINEEDIIIACDKYHDNVSRWTPEKQLEEKYPSKLVLKKMEKMVKKGILDYGVSLRTAWVVRYVQ